MTSDECLSLDSRLSSDDEKELTRCSSRASESSVTSKSIGSSGGSNAHLNILTKGDRNLMKCSKMLVILVLALAATACAVLTYLLMSRGEKNQFERDVREPDF